MQNIPLIHIMFFSPVLYENAVIASDSWGLSIHGLRRDDDCEVEGWCRFFLLSLIHKISHELTSLLWLRIHAAMSTRTSWQECTWTLDSPRIYTPSSWFVSLFIGFFWRDGCCKKNLKHPGVAGCQGVWILGDGSQIEPHLGESNREFD